MLQEAWRTLIANVPFSELQQAVTVQLLDVLFELASTRLPRVWRTVSCSEQTSMTRLLTSSWCTACQEKQLSGCSISALAVCGLCIGFRV